MYQPTDLKKGVVCQIDGKPYRVIEYSQKVMGRGGSIVNVKLKACLMGVLFQKRSRDKTKLNAPR
jgi:translation elongation factor P/translation initiation factor 5A